MDSSIACNFWNLLLGAEPRKLYYAPLTFLSHIGSHSIEWPLDLWRTFFSSSLGVSIPILVNHPRTL